MPLQKRTHSVAARVAEHAYCTAKPSGHPSTCMYMYMYLWKCKTVIGLALRGNDGLAIGLRDRSGYPKVLRAAAKTLKAFSLGGKVPKSSRYVF